MKSETKKIKDELDKYWSLYVRKRDNRCVLCGNYEGEIGKLQAHHWIVSRGDSLRYKFDVRNGVALCYGCHIHRIHTNPTVSLISKLHSKAIAAGIATEEEVEEIIEKARGISKIGIGELREMLDKLKADYNSLPQGGILRAKSPLSRVNEIIANKLS